MHESAAVCARGEVVFLLTGLAVDEDAQGLADIFGVLFGGNAVCRIQQLIEPALLILARGGIRHVCRRSSDAL